MLSTSIIPPHPALQEFVYNYSHCKSVQPIKHLILPWVAHHDTSLCFYLGDVPLQIPNTRKEDLYEPANRITLYGLLTQCRGTMTFDGMYNTFLIEFKPNGFARLFDIAASEICDGVFSADEVVGAAVRRLYAQLVDTDEVRDMMGYADEFLIGILKKRKSAYFNEGITRISDQLLSNTLPNVSQYALQANMSLRNFERRFTEQVGTSPKLFCRLVRFNAAVQLKVARPDKSWTDIAYDCGYFDDMHLIKEFKQFSTESPTIFFENKPFLMGESFRLIDR